MGGAGWDGRVSGEEDGMGGGGVVWAGKRAERAEAVRAHATNTRREGVGEKAGKERMGRDIEQARYRHTHIQYIYIYIYI